MINILFVSSGNSRTGISPIIYHQGESIKALGVNISYFAVRGKGVSGYLYSLLKLRSFLRYESFDLIHAHYGLSGIVSALAKTRRTRLIVSFMGSDLLGIKNSRGKVTITGRLLIQLNRLLVKHLDHCIVKSKEMFDKINSENKSIIPNGVNITRFDEIGKAEARARLRWADNKIHLLFLSDPERIEKNFSLVNDALSIINNPLIEIHFLVNIAVPDLIYHYNAADVCILTSIHEGSPNAIKEAMACNSVIVSTDVGDVKEIFGNTPGCFITSFDPADTANSIQEALKYDRSSEKITRRERLTGLGLDEITVSRKIVSLYSGLI